MFQMPARAMTEAQLDAYEAAIRAFTEVPATVAGTAVCEPVSSIAASRIRCAHAAAVQVSTARWMLDL